jgi:RNA polymerase sigma-70 factor (ECF subfamily)
LELSNVVSCPSNFATRWPQTAAEFETLVDTWQHELVRFAYCRLRNRADAEDVVQDVLLRAYRDRDKHGGQVPVGPYLYRMIANQCTDVLRQRKRKGLPIDDVPAPAMNEPDAGAAKLEEIEALLSGLPSRQAEVMRLRIFTGLPFQNIAQVVGASLPTIKSRFRYGVRKLRDILSR